MKQHQHNSPPLKTAAHAFVIFNGVRHALHGSAASAFYDDGHGGAVMLGWIDNLEPLIVVSTDTEILAEAARAFAETAGVQAVTA